MGRSKSQAFLSTLPFRRVLPATQSQDCDALIALLEQAFRDRVTDSGGTLTLRGGAAFAGASKGSRKVLMFHGADEIAALDRLSGSLQLNLDLPDALAITAAGWGQPIARKCDKGGVRVSIDAATSAEEVLVFTQLVEAAVIGATNRSPRPDAGPTAGVLF